MATIEIKEGGHVVACVDEHEYESVKDHILDDRWSDDFILSFVEGMGNTSAEAWAIIRAARLGR